MLIVVGSGYSLSPQESLGCSAGRTGRIGDAGRNLWAAIDRTFCRTGQEEVFSAAVARRRAGQY